MASAKNQFFMESSICLLAVLFLIQLMGSFVPSNLEHAQHLRVIKPAGWKDSTNNWWEDLTYYKYAVVSFTRCSQGKLVSVGALNRVVVLEKNVPLQPPPIFC